MKKRIFAVSVIASFVAAVVIFGGVASAETKNEKQAREIREAREKIGKLERRISNRTSATTTATSTSSGSSMSSATSTGQSALDCIKNAVDKRESSIISAHNTFSSSISAALESRRNNLNWAWSNTNPTERKSLIKTAWENFKTSSKTARKTLQSGNKATWSAFETARKACKGGNTTAGVAEENEGKGIDTSASN